MGTRVDTWRWLANAISNGSFADELQEQFFKPYKLSAIILNDEGENSFNNYLDQEFDFFNNLTGAHMVFFVLLDAKKHFYRQHEQEFSRVLLKLDRGYKVQDFDGDHRRVTNAFISALTGDSKFYPPGIIIFRSIENISGDPKAIYVSTGISKISRQLSIMTALANEAYENDEEVDLDRLEHNLRGIQIQISEEKMSSMKEILKVGKMFLPGTTKIEKNEARDIIKSKVRELDALVKENSRYDFTGKIEDLSRNLNDLLGVISVPNRMSSQHINHFDGLSDRLINRVTSAYFAAIALKSMGENLSFTGPIVEMGTALETEIHSTFTRYVCKNQTAIPREFKASVHEESAYEFYAQSGRKGGILNLRGSESPGWRSPTISKTIVFLKSLQNNLDWRAECRISPPTFDLLNNFFGKRNTFTHGTKLPTYSDYEEVLELLKKLTNEEFKQFITYFRNQVRETE